MIPYKYIVISPYLRDKTRLFALSSGSQFGNEISHDEHMIERLNNFVGNLDNMDIHNQYNMLRTMDMPNFKRDRVVKNVISDLILPDNFKQHNEIVERYRGELISATDLKRLGDGATRYHIACSRGYERHIVDFITRLDTEMLDRKSIRPLV